MQTRRFMSTGLPVLAVIVAAVSMLSSWATTGLLAHQREADRGQEGGSPATTADSPPRPEADRDRDVRRPRGPEDRPQRPGPPAGPGQREFRFPGLGRPGGSGPMPMGPAGGGSVALAAHGDYVYVLRGNTLYQFAAEDLKLLNKVRLEEERPMPRPMGPRSGPGRGPIDRDPGGDRSPRPRQPAGGQPELLRRQ